MANNIVIIDQDDQLTVVQDVENTVVIDAGGNAGPQGPAGPAGPAGPQAMFGTPTSTQVAAGGAPTAAISGTGTADDPYILAFGLVTGNTGDQGAQGRFDINIFTRSATAPTTAPTGGSYNFDTGAFTPPTGYVLAQDIASLSGSDQLYQAVASFNPATESGTVTPTWSVPFEAGGTGPAGLSGMSVTVFYADDAVGTNASTTQGAGQMFIQFVVHTAGTTPAAPTSGYVDFIGDNGMSVTVFYADDANGTNASTTRAAGQDSSSS